MSARNGLTASHNSLDIFKYYYSSICSLPFRVRFFSNK
uniref:Uncharacterized protein n=1 Tax=Anguilla anguilla TaxID=7936 RepID=A0A0E9WI28_ANGAN